MINFIDFRLFRQLTSEDRIRIKLFESIRLSPLVCRGPLFHLHFSGGHCAKDFESLGKKDVGSIGVYLDRVAGCDCDHRRPDRTLVAGSPTGA